ncbi:MAG TPA: hypothetical protein VFS16_15060 [Acidimicrobiia bacterium]|nr:hypothetical protein [Acidimicrobiia bacterium]
MRTWGLRRTGYRRRLLVLLCVAGPGALLLAPAGAGSGGTPQAYVAVASASSARLTWIVPGEFAVEEVTDSGGPIAQSRLDAGGGESFASLPYPGGTAVAYQGLLSVATGISSPFDYPFFVQAVNPGQPEKEVADPSGTYRLHAKAEGASTAAVARFRPGNPEAAVSGGEATTSIATDGSTVTATADSLSEAISLGGGALRIGSVRSRSVTTFADGADAPKTETSLVVDGLAAGDVRFGVGPEGFVVLGQPVPYSPKDAQALLDQILGPANLSLRFVKAEPLTGGGRAAALEIVTNQAHPPFPASNVTLRLGGASSAVSLGEGPLPVPVTDVTGGSTVVTPAPAGPDGVGSPPAATTGAAPVPAPPGLPAPELLDPVPFTAGAFASPAIPALGTGAVSGTTAAVTGAVPPAPLPPAGSGGTEIAVQPIVRPREVGSARLLYAIVGGAAALMLMLGGAVTRRGGAAAWLDA